MDYGKYKYQASKRVHEAKKKQTKIVVKEIKLRPKTEEHDLQFKIKHSSQFLLEGNKVKVTVFFRGREINYKDLGIELLNRFIKSLEEISTVESPIRSEGRTAFIILSPKKTKE